MTDKGIAHIGIGSGKGDDKALDAVKQAVASPLLETTIVGASHVIINISGDISLMDANDAASYVQDLAGDEANIIFGAMYDDTYTDEATITVIATGLDEKSTTKVLPKNSSFAKMSSAVSKPSFDAGHAQTASSQTETPVFKPLPGLNMPKRPESKIPETEIKIPEFLQRNK